MGENGDTYWKNGENKENGEKQKTFGGTLLPQKKKFILRDRPKIFFLVVHPSPTTQKKKF